MDALLGFEFSPSAVKKWDECNLSYGFTYICGLRGPQTAGANRGKKIHAEMEDWYDTYTVPSDAAAKRLLPLAPHPKHPDLRVEAEFRHLYRVGAMRGFIDLLVPKPELRFLPKDLGFSPDRPIVFDWKSTSVLDSALTPEELAVAPQGVAYGIEARLATGRNVRAVPDVDLAWIYTGTKEARAFPVVVTQTLDHVEQGLLQILPKAEKMAEAKRRGVEGLKDLDYDLRSCETKWKCPHRSYCPRYAEYHRKTPEPIPPPDSSSELEMTSPSILEKLKALGAQPPPKAIEPPKETVTNPVSQTVSTDPNAVKPSPVPDLPKIDVSGTLKPAPEPILILPPDAAPELTPETAAGLGTEIVVAPPKAKRGRPRKAPMTLSEIAPEPEAVEESVSSLLKKALQIALDRDMPTAEIAAALDVIRKAEV